MADSADVKARKKIIKLIHALSDTSRSALFFTRNGIRGNISPSFQGSCLPTLGTKYMRRRGKSWVALSRKIASWEWMNARSLVQAHWSPEATTGW